MGAKPKTSADKDVSLRQRRTLNRKIPGIDGRDAALKRRKILDELDPKTALETSIAIDIAADDIEINMLRERKNMLLWQFAAQPMFLLIRGTGIYDDATAGDLARAWITGSQEAEEEIFSLGIDPEFAHNLAFTENVLLIEMMEKSIERLQRSRRKLMDDYNRLKQVGKDYRRVRGDTIDAELFTERPHGT
jgi:hypothetical protein